jgi:hypothetical protein
MALSPGHPPERVGSRLPYPGQGSPTAVGYPLRRVTLVMSLPIVPMSMDVQASRQAAESPAGVTVTRATLAERSAVTSLGERSSAGQSPTATPPSRCTPTLSGGGAP